MAIKVKHEGNVTSRVVAAAKGGRGKRAAEDGKAWMQVAAQEAMAGNRQLQGAHASPVAPGHATAQLTHAQTGAAPGIVHAPSGGLGGSRSSGTGAGTASTRGTGAGDSSRRLKVTGDKFFQKPDKESVWDWDSRQWVREYLPGEYEAEAQQRIGDVKNAQQMELDEHRAGLARQEYEYKLSTQQKSEIAKINNALDEARRSGRFSDDELAELERQADAKRMGIQPLPTPKKEPQVPTLYTDEGGQWWVQNGQKWEPVQQPKEGKVLTLNDVLKNIPTKKNNPDDPNGAEIDIPINERLDMAQKILDRMNGASSPTPEAQPDPLTQAFQNYMFGPQYPGAPLRTDQPVQPVQPAAPAPQEPSEAEKKWSAFKGR
jgi:hypothetical protein